MRGVGRVDNSIPEAKCLAVSRRSPTYLMYC